MKIKFFPRLQNYIPGKTCHKLGQCRGARSLCLEFLVAKGVASY